VSRDRETVIRPKNTFTRGGYNLFTFESYNMLNRIQHVKLRSIRLIGFDWSLL